MSCHAIPYVNPDLDWKGTPSNWDLYGGSGCRDLYGWEHTHYYAGSGSSSSEACWSDEYLGGGGGGPGGVSRWPNTQTAPYGVRFIRPSRELTGFDGDFVRQFIDVPAEDYADVDAGLMTFQFGVGAVVYHIGNSLLFEPGHSCTHTTSYLAKMYDAVGDATTGIQEKRVERSSVIVSDLVGAAFDPLQLHPVTWKVPPGTRYILVGFIAHTLVLPPGSPYRVNDPSDSFNDVEVTAFHSEAKLCFRSPSTLLNIVGAPHSATLIGRNL